MVSTKFFQSDLGDHFIVKNAGNFVPHAKQLTYESAATEPGALELGCGKEGINHVIVCGHSDCRVILYNCFIPFCAIVCLICERILASYAVI